MIILTNIDITQEKPKIQNLYFGRSSFPLNEFSKRKRGLNQHKFRHHLEFLGTLLPNSGLVWNDKEIHANKSDAGS